MLGEELQTLVERRDQLAKALAERRAWLAEHNYGSDWVFPPEDRMLSALSWAIDRLRPGHSTSESRIN